MTFDEAVPREFHIVVALGDQGRLVRRWGLSATVRFAIPATGAPFLRTGFGSLSRTPPTGQLSMRRAHGAQHHWLVLIDDCLRLVAAVRQTWKGLSGDDQVWPEIERFFAELVEQR